jgi:hypothetical protein
MQEMTFWDHLEELRKMLFRGIGATVQHRFLFFYARDIRTVVMEPCFGDFPVY